jgi:polysaccharide chain length determinant protein (PEP-CTERM system associated)
MATNGTQNTLSIFSVIDALRRRKVFIILPTLVFTVLCGLYGYIQKDRYRATASLAAEVTTPPEYLKHVVAPPLNIEDHLWVVREVLFSDPVLDEAAREMKRYKNVNGPLPAEAIEELKSAINLKVEDEHSFQVTVEAGDPIDAMNATNKLSDSFVKRASANRVQKSQDAASVIDDQLSSLKDRLEQQSTTLHAYKQKAVDALPDHIDDNIRAVDSLKADYRDRTTKIAEEEARRSAIQKQLQELEAKGVLDQPVVVEKSPEETRLDELRTREKDMAARYTARHPEVIQIQKLIEEQERIVAAQPPKSTKSEPSGVYLHYVELKSELDAINERVGAYRRDQDRINAQMAQYNQRIGATPEHERVIENLQRELQVGESQFHALLDKRLDASMAKDLAQSETGIAFALVQPATLPTEPFSPQRGRLVVIGLFAGLVLGLGLTFVLEQNDTTFGTLDDFQAFTTLPAIGVVPNVVPKIKKDPDSVPVVSWSDPESVAAEQYRVLALKVQQQCDAARSKVVMITSAAGGEGKSLTVINLAIALSATADGPVLVVDADMRKPRLNEYLDLAVPTGRSFYDLLVHPEDDLDRYVQQVRGFQVITANIPTVNPVPALASGKARMLFDRLKQKYSYVIVDAPPALPIADSHILSGIADNVLFVVRARKTPRELFQHALEGFEPGKLLGVVLNDVDYQRSRYAYAYEYYKKVAA